MGTSMKLPNKFSLMGSEWTVEYIDTELDGEWGHCDYERLKIVVKVKHDGKPVKQCIVEHTFFHELTHAILFMMNQEELNNDEAFVDVFSGLIHQALWSFDLPELV